jgi:hypothetical protein
MRRILMIRIGLVALVTVLLGERAVTAQTPAKFTNLQLLPKDISRPELIAVMRDFATALGVRCNHCHVGDDPDTLRGFDFASDSKRTKNLAREMMRMTREINDQLLPKANPPGAPRVSCMTCHRRLTVPRLLVDVLDEIVESRGVDASLKEYRSLRTHRSR